MTVLELLEPFTSVTTQWNELAARTQADPFVQRGWLTAWWSAFGGPGELHALVLRRDGQLAAALALAVDGRAVRAPANPHSPFIHALAEDADAAAELGRELAGLPLHRLELLSVPSGDAMQTAFAEAARARGHRVESRVVQRSPYIALDGGWDGFQAGLGGKFKREIRRRRRKLEESEGELTLDLSDGSERLDELLDEGFRIEGSAWKEGEGTAIVSSAETERFYREVAAWAAGEGMLRLAFLRAGGRALAFDYCLEHGGAHYLVKTGYDPEQRALAPGTLMREAMIRRAFELGLERYEFLGHDDPWKLEWTATVREHELVQAYGPAAADRLYGRLRSMGRPIRRYLRRLRPSSRPRGA